ncbi:asparagine synthase-related protein [Peribacillus simplex]|uniref:asparagine synthase-related protein n=1 Tax=Peribacillus simplex TaxID=1478 RepID=UPI0037F25C51
MPGFFGFVSSNKENLDKDLNIFEVIEKNNGLLQEEITIKTSLLHGKLYRNAVKKFENDKAFYEDKDEIFIVDGVISNKNKLYEDYLVEDEKMPNLLKKMTQKNPKSFFRDFRGSFAGISFNKKTNELVLYTNQIGDKDIFYYNSKEYNTLYFSTDFDTLIRMINKHINEKFDINNNAVYSLMTHSHVLCNETLFENVNRLTPGHFIYFSNSNIEKKAYYTFDNQPIEISEDEALEKLDELFRQAIKRSFNKDLEYGYKHLVALSGGLDSRMTAWVGYQMGYTNMLNYTFSQTDYLDQKIAQQISNHLKTEWIFKSLDNGTYIYKYFDDSVRITGARSQASTAAHTLSMLNNINFKNYGLVHTGQLGDVFIGTFYDNGEKQNFKPGSGAYSNKLINKVKYTKNNAYHLDDQEIFKIYNRGLTGVNTGLKPMLEYTETLAPHMDIDLVDFCLKLPLEYRKGHKIYIKWINKFYPEAANFTYEKVKGKINRKLITIKGIPVPWTSIPWAAIKMIKNKFGLKLSTKNHMSPIEYWYKNNSFLEEFYEAQFSENINLINNVSLRSDCEYLFKNGNALEKDQVITFLVFIKQMKIFVK